MYFLLVRGLPFYFNGVLWGTDIFNFNQVPLFIFSFMVSDFGIPSKKCLPNPRLWRSSPMLSSRNIMVLGLHADQMTYSELIFGIWWEVRTDVHFSKQIFIQSSTIHWNDFHFWLGTFVNIYIYICLDSILFRLSICLFFHQCQLPWLL